MTIARLELPAVYIDEVIFDTLALPAGFNYLEIFNRNPEPDEEGVWTRSLIEFYITGRSGVPPILSQTVVEIQVTSANGFVGPRVKMYDGSLAGFQPGFSGPSSDVVTVYASTYHFIFDLTLAIDSESTVEIFVSSSVPNFQLNESWTFTIEDVTAPIIESVTARDKQIVRVKFNEPIVQTAASNLDSALNPSNYSFERLTVPAVNIVAEEVEVVTDTSVDVTIDIEMTPGATYELTITSVEDTIGNLILAPFNRSNFTGYIPEIPERRDFQLWKMIPQKNRDEDNGDGYKFILCLQEVTDLLLCTIDEWTNILDPDIAPENFLDAMLDDLGNPFDFDLDVTQKRKLIRVLVTIYRQKGTGIGIINVVRFFLGIEIEINAFSIEGWDLGIDELGDTLVEGTAILGPGTSYGLYSFEIVSPIALTQEQRDQITDIANYMKPGHTHLVKIVEPEIPTVIDHIELGLSELGGNEWQLH